MDTYKPLYAPFFRSCLKGLETVGDVVRMLVQVVGHLPRRPPALSLCLSQLYHIGVASLPVVAITGFFTGLVLAAQSIYQLSDKGLLGITGVLVTKAMMTELGPILTAFMVTGRVGAAICAELGSMRVTEQIDALETLGVNPLTYLVAPRLCAGTIVLPLLTLFSIIMGVGGGYLIGVHLFGISPAGYLDPIPIHMKPSDLAIGLIKSAIFGVVILAIACYKGMKTTGGAAGVGAATTQSVVTTYCCILCLNFVLTLALNLLFTHV